jgi:hypothetical protein
LQIHRCGWINRQPGRKTMVAGQAWIIHNNRGGLESARPSLAGDDRTIGGLRRRCILWFGDPTIDLLIARGDYAVG